MCGYPQFFGGILIALAKVFVFYLVINRLRVVSNFGDGVCGAGEIHMRMKVRGDVFDAPFASRLLELSGARVYFAHPTTALAKIRDYSQSKS